MNMGKSFPQAKINFDSQYKNLQEFVNFLPEHLTLKKKSSVVKKDGSKNEQYYKWQFLYALINSGLYAKEYIGTEVYFPKGNENSAPIKLDCAIFDNVNWFEHYKAYHNDKSQEALDWLRKHIMAVIEIKKEDSKNIETVWNQQLKSAMKESENDFCLGILYDTERLYLFQKKKNVFTRLDESLNLKGDKSTIKDLSLHLFDSYYKIPSFIQLQKKITQIEIDRSQRTVDDLDVITGIYSKQLTDGISNILRVIDKIGMKNQRGYEILIQIMTLKIFDEKRSLNTDPQQSLDFYKSQFETNRLNLLFYITKGEKEHASLGDEDVQSFIDRMRTLYNEASESYKEILNAIDTETINWDNSVHIQIMSEVVEQFQDYSFVLSHKTDLYQIVFYKFANEFSKADKGQFITPIPLIDFLVRIVNPRNNEKIIDPTVGIADFLSVSYVNSKGKLNDKNIYGLDNDKQMLALAQLNMLLNGDGEAVLEHKPDKGSIIWKFAKQGGLIELNPTLNRNGEWDHKTQLKKFDVVLTNPPFGEDRKWEPKTAQETAQAEMYELWNVARSGNWIDLGVVFLENAYRILGNNGRMGIVLSNSIASIDRWNKARAWLLGKMRIVALFDLPANIFADTGVNTTLIVAYKPNENELKKLRQSNYEVFVKNIKKIGYEVRTSKRVKFFNPIYKINETTFNIEQDEEGMPLIDEEFTETVNEFHEWCKWQEVTLQNLFKN
jgi:type I restriction enzyme M protein